MKISDDDRPTICGKRLISNDRQGIIKLLANAALNTHVDGQVNVIPDGRTMQGFVDNIIERGQAHTPTEVIVIGMFDAGRSKKRTDIIPDYPSQRRLIILPYIPTSLAELFRLGQQDAIAVKDATTYRRV